MPKTNYGVSISSFTISSQMDALLLCVVIKSQKLRNAPYIAGRKSHFRGVYKGTQYGQAYLFLGTLTLPIHFHVIDEFPDQISCAQSILQAIDARACHSSEWDDYVGRQGEIIGSIEDQREHFKLLPVLAVHT